MAERGRPKINIDLDELEKLCRLQCTLDEIAAYWGCSRDTIERRMKEDEKIKEVIEKGRAMGKISLRRKQWQIMESQNSTAMAIWLGKNMLGQTDKVDVDLEVDAGDGLSKAFSLLDEILKNKQ